MRFMLMFAFCLNTTKQCLYPAIEVTQPRSLLVVFNHSRNDGLCARHINFVIFLIYFCGFAVVTAGDLEPSAPASDHAFDNPPKGMSIMYTGAGAHTAVIATSSPSKIHVVAHPAGPLDTSMLRARQCSLRSRCATLIAALSYM